MIKQLITYIFSGISIGIANIIPGISGGTMAVMLGLYDQLILSLVDLVRFRNLRKSLIMVIPIAIGAIIGIKGLASIIVMLLELYYAPTQFFWVGLIAGSVPGLSTAFHVQKFTIGDWILLTCSVVALIGIGQLTISEGSITEPTLWMFVGMGIIAAASMVLPGISGSLIMMILGMYYPILMAIKTINIPVILAVGSGAMMGGILAITGIKWLLHHHQRPTHAVVMGLVLGSIPVLCPSVQLIKSSFILSGVTLIIGIGLSFSLFRR